MSQLAGVNAIYLGVALDEIWGYGHSIFHFNIQAREVSCRSHHDLSSGIPRDGAIGPEKELRRGRAFGAARARTSRREPEQSRAELSSTATTKGQAGFR